MIRKRTKQRTTSMIVGEQIAGITEKHYLFHGPQRQPIPINSEHSDYSSQQSSQTESGALSS